jgi:hypothetical protein
VEQGGRKKYITERNGRNSWKGQGIVAFCTCQWNEWIICPNNGMSGHFTLYQTTLHCILRDSYLLTFTLKFLNFDGRKSTSNIHLQIGKWQSDKKRKCSYTAAMYYFTFWLPQWTKLSSVSCKCHALCLENQRLKNLATAPTRFWLHTRIHKHLAWNFICRHIYQHFIITTHYYIVFYHFINS